MGKIIQKLLIFFIGFVCCLNFDFILAMKPVNKISSPGGQRPILPLLQGSILPHTVINLWPSERALSKGVSLCNQVPGIICITPDEKAVITTHNGKVFYCSFSDEKEKKLLFELPQAKHSPMITMAQKTPSSVSAPATVNCSMTPCGSPTPCAAARDSDRWTTPARCRRY